MTDVKEYERFYTRKGFNNSLNHFQSVLSIIDNFQSYTNIADSINEYIDDETIEQHQVIPIVNSLLVDKFSFSYKSYNIKISFDNFSEISEILSKWNGIDIVIGYHNPNIGYVVINPKKRENWNLTGGLKNHELITIYVGDHSENKNSKTSETVINSIINILENKKYKVPPSVLTGKYVTKVVKEKKQPVVKKKTVKAKGKAALTAEVAVEKPVKESTVIPSNARMTPLYSVPVTNELFHNGNVEAWKRIINSYYTKYPGLEVIIFYEGERIHDINTLFKWGKVKHGSAILFAVAGKEIKDVAKLQRYLKQGASQRFEDFLKGPVNAILKLF
jgi:hypothetical protein